MRIILILISFQLAFFAAFGEGERVEDFRDIKWGSSKDNIYRNGEQLKFDKVKGEPNSGYVIPGDPMNIGTVKLNAVEYFFTEEDNRFYKVLLKGDRAYVDDMIFILNYKFGESENKSELDGVKYFQWIIQDVTFTLSVFTSRDFECSIQSDWRAAEKYKKNTSVKDF